MENIHAYAVPARNMETAKGAGRGPAAAANSGRAVGCEGVRGSDDLIARLFSGTHAISFAMLSSSGNLGIARSQMMLGNVHQFLEAALNSPEKLRGLARKSETVGDLNAGRNNGRPPATEPALAADCSRIPGVRPFAYNIMD
jgi:hypothetical protein